MDQIVLNTKNLSFRETIHYQDIQIQEHKVNFIVGSSGTGKSTLLRLFNATLMPSGGSIYYREKDIADIDTIELRKEVTLISQSVYLFDASIKENFRQFYEFRGLETPSEQVMLDFLNICCITFALDKDCTTMSGGERQRVYIAIFLSFTPRILMLDEPTSALDQENSHNVIQNILKHCKEKGITVIIVSHDSSLTKEFGEQIITIGKGDK
ncbi:MAG: transporter related [Herbinix sp.]|jgi:putative ABC transport system ATP-binding protein|nr:transporter related [Herbinix sp.]